MSAEQPNVQPTTGRTQLDQLNDAWESVGIAITRSRDPQFTLRYCEGGDLREGLEHLFDIMRDTIAESCKGRLRTLWLEGFDEVRRESTAQLPSMRSLAN
jgi:hypothetical protein